MANDAILEIVSEEANPPTKGMTATASSEEKNLSILFCIIVFSSKFRVILWQRYEINVEYANFLHILAFYKNSPLQQYIRIIDVENRLQPVIFSKGSPIYILYKTDISTDENDKKLFFR